MASDANKLHVQPTRWKCECGWTTDSIGDDASSAGCGSCVHFCTGYMFALAKVEKAIDANTYPDNDGGPDWVDPADLKSELGIEIPEGPDVEPEPDPDPEWVTSDNYPTEAALKRIREWGTDHESLFDFVGSCWAYPDRWIKEYSEEDGKLFVSYVCSTGGWSGNEDLIAALQSNFLAWSLHWQRSERGGKYEFLLAHCLSGGRNG